MELSLADKLYSSTQVCDILGVSLRTLYRYVESGDLQSIQTPTGRHRFTKKHMEDFLSKGRKMSEKAVYERMKQDSVTESEIEEPEISNLSLASEEPSKELGEVAQEESEKYYESEVSDVRQLAKKIKEVVDNFNIRYAFTGLGGLSLHFPIKPFSNLEIYAERENLDIWIAELGLKEGSKLSANLKVKFNDSVLDGASMLGGLMVADKDVLALDLEESGNIDLAKQLRSH